jgi:hypothetical protein
VDDGSDALALVVVGAAQEHQQAPVADRQRPDGPAVALDGRSAEAGQLGQRHLVVGGPQGVRSREPAGAHDEGEVVVTATGTFAECIGSLTGEFGGGHLPYITTMPKIIGGSLEQHREQTRHVARRPGARHDGR